MPTLKMKVPNLEIRFCQDITNCNPNRDQESRNCHTKATHKLQVATYEILIEISSSYFLEQLKIV